MNVAPPKPPRSSVEEEGGRTLWQIYWNEDTDEPVVSMVDISKIELSTDSDFSPQVRLDEETGDIVVFEKNAAELEGKIKKGGSIFKKPFYKKKREGVDMSAEEESMVGRKFLIRSRSDSDLDLIPPGRSRSDMCARARWCCVSCRTVEFWKHYWWVPTLIVAALAVYVLITLVILKSLLSSPSTP